MLLIMCFVLIYHQLHPEGLAGKTYLKIFKISVILINLQFFFFLFFANSFLFLWYFISSNFDKTYFHLHSASLCLYVALAFQHHPQTMHIFMYARIFPDHSHFVALKVLFVLYNRYHWVKIFNSELSIICWAATGQQPCVSAFPSTLARPLPTESSLPGTQHPPRWPHAKW